MFNNAIAVHVIIMQHKLYYIIHYTIGYDHDEVGNQYCCSFPFEKAIDPFGDVIVAYEMNGAPIPRQHGYPVRAIVPGKSLVLYMYDWCIFIV